jgi:hypothetical protein
VPAGPDRAVGLVPVAWYRLKSTVNVGLGFLFHMAVYVTDPGVLKVTVAPAAKMFPLEDDRHPPKV